MGHAVPLKVKGMEVWLLDAGEDLLEGLKTMAEERGVSNGLILSGFGSLSTLSVKNPVGGNFPPPMASTKGTGPYEMVAITGTIGEVAVKGDTVHGKVHVHIAVTDKDGRALGGSLDVGSKVFWKAQINVAIL
ncbi:MAG TPA: DNA-binding protein [Firmicutes bacterium]|nr:DNA-binding protein [Bacillota bacterium]